MAGIAGMLAAGALKVAAGKMAEAAGDRFMLQWRFRENLEDMQETTRSIEAVLEDAEKKSVEDKTTQLWLERLTQVSYDISDMFDEFEVNTTRKTALLQKVRMPSKMKKVKETLDKISNERQTYNFTTSSSSSDQQVINRRVTSPEVIEAKILGRDKEKKKIMALLTRASTSSDFIVLPIYGIGGIGKTTLAKLLFKDSYFKDYEKAWVYVSQTFDLNRIKEAVRSQLQMKQGQLANTQEKDVGASAPKSFLIVIDDLWEKNDFKLEDLKDSLEIVGNGHKVHVIVTTREASIAEKVQTIQAHKLHPLSDDVCWDIIKQKSEFEHKPDKERLEVIGKEIAERCGGVALAACAIGYILRMKRDFHEWDSVKHSAIWNESSSEYSPYNDVHASLKLSYTSMPSQLRLCFTYCAIFPKGHKIAKDELIYQWAALGFIESSDEFPNWQHGNNCIDQLLDMSFLEREKSPSVDWEQRKYVTLFTMHDLVHDLARMIMGDIVLNASEKSKFKGNKCRYALLADCSKPLNSSVTYPDKIRALKYLGSGGTGCCHDEFSTAKYLRILDLGGCSIKKLPSSIGKLRLLRYLNAPGIMDEKIPSCMTKLSKLQYLNLSGSCGLLELPESIGRMEGLKYLNLSKCERIEMLPESFGKLQNLVHLDLSKCEQLEMLPESFGKIENLSHLNLSNCMRIKVLPESFGELKKLARLDLSKCLHTEMLPESFGDLENLVHLDLSECEQIKMLPDSFGKLQNLAHLDLSSCLRIEMLPESFGNLKNLAHLDLSNCRQIKMLPESFVKLKNLARLDLSNCMQIKNVLESFGELENLVHLNLSQCEQIDMLPESFGELKNLVHLDLSKCKKIKMLPGSFGKLENLVHLDLSQCDEITCLPDSFWMLQNLVHLDLSKCDKIICLPDSFWMLGYLVHLDLSYCYQLKTIPIDMYVLAKVQYLNLAHCYLPPKELHRVIVTLTDEARYLNLSNCWNPFLPHGAAKPASLDDIDSFFDKISTLSNLEHLDLSHNDGFRTLPDSFCNLTKLRTLDISNCSDIRKLPEYMMHMDSLKFLITTGCSNLDGFTMPTDKKLIPLPNFVVHAAEGEQSSNLIVLKDASPRDLAIRCLENVRSVEEARGIELSKKESLVDLTLDWTGGTERLVEDMELLRELLPPSNLELFTLQGYDSVSFPAWLEGITFYLPNLVRVELKGLSRCSSLPPLGQLPDLKVLCLETMPSITKIDRDFCGDGMMKAFTRLEELFILDMENLEEWSTTYSFGEGGADEFMFPNLESLKIRMCPKLRVGPCPPRVRNTWTLCGCDGVLLQWGETALHHNVCSTSAALVGTLVVESCKEPMHKWMLLYHLRGLQDLTIQSCVDLSSSPEITSGVLASLESLNFDSIKALPQWFCECVSLKKLIIKDCGDASAFMESIQQLTNLERLKVNGCPELRQWIELKENETKFAHIKTIRLDGKLYSYEPGHGFLDEMQRKMLMLRNRPPYPLNLVTPPGPRGIRIRHAMASWASETPPLPPYSLAVGSSEAVLGEAAALRGEGAGSQEEVSGRRREREPNAAANLDEEETGTLDCQQWYPPNFIL